MIERRQFLKTLGIGGSALALEHCAPAPSDTLLPSLIPSADTTPGVPALYATSCRECPAGCGMLARVMNGRVIKVEGNPKHPISRGHLCARGQATVQSLYDPDRFGMPRHRGADGVLHQLSWDDAESLLTTRIRDAMRRGRNRVAWLGGLAGPSFDRFVAEWLASVGSNRRVVYEPFDYEPLRAAGNLAFGRAEIPRYDLDHAGYVLAFGADFLETWISNVEFTSAYAALRRRRMRDSDGSFTWVSPRLSMTGLNSDAWVPTAPGSEVFVALAIAQAIVADGLAHPSASPHLAWLAPALAPYAAERVSHLTAVDPPTIRTVAKQFATARPGVALGGGVAGAGEHHAIELELVVLILNVLAGNVGTTVTYGAGCAFDHVTPRADVAAMVEAMRSGDIDVLLVHRANPVLTLPAAMGFEEALRHVPFVVTFANLPDETSDRAHLVLPDHHPVESWDDYSPRGGVTNLMQPVMAPLLHSRASADVLLRIGRQLSSGSESASSWPDYLRRQWSAPESSQADADHRWYAAVRDGGVFPAPPSASSAEAEQQVPEVSLRDVSDMIRRIEVPPGAPEALALVTYPSVRFYDGRNANDSWLREVPDPVTGLVWNGWIEVHPDAARAHGLADGDQVAVETSAGRVNAVCRVYGGLHPRAIAMPLGFGRTAALRSAGGVGANAARLLPPHARDGNHAAWSAIDVRLTRVSGGRRIISLQAADATAEGAPAIAQIVRPENIDRPHPSTPLSTLYPTHAHPAHRWGMAIDLNACTGCSACVVACYAENNVAVVGAEECARGHEMAWIRVERHEHAIPGAGATRRPGAVFLPMLCQQCDNAPCESVCPVYATYHNPEGLNAQIYNRCIGTRFCSNNCPYKVRRFNWSAHEWPAPLDLQLNPDVTVRSAGVMEKCTFCVQRIQAAEADARRNGRNLRDGDVTPACAQTCPADAIVFGDLHDPHSRVSQLSAEARGYHVLEELGTRPAITYLRRSIPGAPDHDA